MKAVDIIVEMRDEYLFIEIKNFKFSDSYNTSVCIDKKDSSKNQEIFNNLKNGLKYKYRDSFLYRYAENKVDKPIQYLCGINFENPLAVKMSDFLRREIPLERPSTRWKKKIVHSCHVLNMAQWNKVFPQWSVSKYSA